MLTLNILPERLKKEFKLSYTYFILKNILLLFVLLTAIVAILLLLSDHLLQLHFGEISGSPIIYNKNYLSFKNKSTAIKAKLNEVSSIQEDSITWSKLLEDVMERTNENISYSRVAINREDKELTLTGHADTREALLELRKNFENFSIYSNIDFPIQNILEKEDIDFNIKMNVNPYEFR